LLAFSSF